MKLSQENVVLIIVALALCAVVWFELKPRAVAEVPTPAAPIPEPDVSRQAMPWYFGNTVYANAMPLPSVIPRLTVGNGAGGAAPIWALSDCKMCAGIGGGIRN